MTKLPKMSYGKWKRVFQSLNISVKSTEIHLQHTFNCCQSLHSWFNESPDILLMCSGHDLWVCLRKLAESYLCAAHQSYSTHQGDLSIPLPCHTSHSRLGYFANILSFRHQAFQVSSYRMTEDTSLRQDSQCLINQSFNLAMRVGLIVLGGKNEAVTHWTTLT